MSKWQIPAKGGYMESNRGVYYQNMTNKDVEERLKKNDVLLSPSVRLKITVPMRRWRGYVSRHEVV